MKKLIITRFCVAAVWNQLRQTPPREFSTYEEIEKVKEILELLKLQVQDYVDFIETSDAKRLDYSLGSIKQEEFQAFLNEQQKKAIEMDTLAKKEKITIEIETKLFNKLFDLFNKLGKNWFNNITEYIEFKTALDETNMRSDNAENEIK